MSLISAYISAKMEYMPAKHIPALPDDVLLRVFEILLDNPQGHLSPYGFFDEGHSEGPSSGSRVAFVHCIPLVNRTWYSLSQRVLYAQVKLSNPQGFLSFREKVVRNPEVARYTTTLIVTCRLEKHEDRITIKKPVKLKPVKSVPNEYRFWAPPVSDGSDSDSDEEGFRTEEYSWIRASYYISDKLLFDLLRSLPNLRHLCLTGSSRFTLRHEHMSVLPANMDLLCLHSFRTSSESLSILPEHIVRLNLDHCSIDTSRQTLELPGLRYLNLYGVRQYCEWTKDTFRGCTELEHFRTPLGYASEEAQYHAALASLFPRLKHLHIVSEKRRIQLKVWFETHLSNLEHLVIEGNLENEDVPFLPASLKTLTWINAGVCDQAAVNSLLKLLKHPEGLPNLVNIPRVDLDREIVLFGAGAVDFALAQEVLRYLRDQRGLRLGPNADNISSLWLLCGGEEDPTSVNASVLAILAKSLNVGLSGNEPEDEAEECVVC